MTSVPFWKAVLIISLVLSVALAVFLTVWTVRVAKCFLSTPENDSKNHYTKVVVIIMLGPLTIGMFLTLLWLEDYPPPTSSIVLFSIAIATFGLFLFIGKKNQGEGTNWKDWTCMILFISSFLLLFSMMCLTRGANLKLKYRLNYHGAASILGYEYEYAVDDDAANDDQGAFLTEGNMELAWSCGDFVCLNESTFFCISNNDDGDDDLTESEVLANTTGFSKYQIYNGYSPCGEYQEIGDYDPDVAPEESGNPYVNVHGVCISEDDCPVQVDPVYYNTQSSFYTDEELNVFLQNVYWRRIDNAPEMVLAISRNLGVASIVGFASVVGFAVVVGVYYALHCKMSDKRGKKVELLPTNEGVQA